MLQYPHLKQLWECSFESAALKAPNDIKDLNGTKRQSISLPCSLSSLPYTGARRRDAGTAHPSCKGQSSAQAATHQHPPAHWGQGFGPSSKQGAFPRCEGRKEKGKRGEGEREGAGAGAPLRGEAVGALSLLDGLETTFRPLQAIWIKMWYAAYLQNFCPPQGCVWVANSRWGEPKASAVPLVHGGTFSSPCLPASAALPWQS